MSELSTLRGSDVSILNVCNNRNRLKWNKDCVFAKVLNHQILNKITILEDPRG